MNGVRWNERTNFTMLTDFYELTDVQGVSDHDMAETIAYFDLFSAAFLKAAAMPSWGRSGADD